MINVYGIKNCDTVKKALKWFEQQALPTVFHDYRTEGVDSAWLAEMEAMFGWENLLNKRSTTWRNLDESRKNNLTQPLALALLAEQPTLIKRPIVLAKGVVLIGFNENEYRQAFVSV